MQFADDLFLGCPLISLLLVLIGWPLLFDAENLSEGALHGALDYCLTEKARQEAKKCARKAYNTIEHMRASFLAELIELSNSGEHG